ncbi:MAG: hypothetical protein JHC93_00805 [Parachlamydiales bacterium]|nr:hypothetical protein [Parachlamydiales bacterium]
MNDKKIISLPNDCNCDVVVETNPISDDLSEEMDMAAFLKKWKNAIFYITMGIIIAALALYRFVIHDGQEKEMASYNAAVDFHAIQSQPNEEVFQRLIKTLRANPELQTRYEGQLAQKMLNTHDTDQALGLAKDALIHQKKFSPELYPDFASNSLMIMDAKRTGNYSGALKDALDLKQKLEMGSKGTALYLTHLFRIAALAQEVNDKTLELATWQEMQQVIEETKNEETQQWLALFQQGDLTLNDYIAERQSLIK